MNITKHHVQQAGNIPDGAIAVNPRTSEIHVAKHSDLKPLLESGDLQLVAGEYAIHYYWAHENLFFAVLAFNLDAARIVGGAHKIAVPEFAGVTVTSLHTFGCGGSSR